DERRMRQVFVDREQPRLRLFEGRAGVLLATTRAQRGDSVGEIERHFVEQGALFGVERRGAGRTDRQHTEDVRTLPERQQDAPQGRVRHTNCYEISLFYRACGGGELPECRANSSS